MVCDYSMPAADSKVDLNYHMVVKTGSTLGPLIDCNKELPYLLLADISHRWVSRTITLFFVYPVRDTRYLE